MHEGRMGRSIVTVSRPLPCRRSVPLSLNFSNLTPSTTKVTMTFVRITPFLERNPSTLCLFMLIFFLLNVPCFIVLLQWRHAGPMFQVDNVSFRYPSSPEHVLKTITLDIDARRDRIAFLGKNGSGKSTLLSLLAGLEMPSAGVMKKHHGYIAEMCIAPYLPLLTTSFVMIRVLMGCIPIHHVFLKTRFNV